MEDGQATSLQSQQEEMEGSRQLMQADDLENRSATRGVKDLPQQGEEDVNAAMSASSVISADRCYNI